MERGKEVRKEGANKEGGRREERDAEAGRRDGMELHWVTVLHRSSPTLRHAEVGRKEGRRHHCTVTHLLLVRSVVYLRLSISPSALPRPSLPPLATCVRKRCQHKTPEICSHSMLHVACENPVGWWGPRVMLAWRRGAWRGE